MYIMSQDGHRLVNSDYVKQFYIEKIHEGARLIAETDTSIIQLGTYDNIDHAKDALEFIGICVVDKDKQNKITQVPTQEDMAMCNGLCSEGLKLSSLKKVLAHMLSLKEENHDDSKFDIESMLKDIFN